MLMSPNKGETAVHSCHCACPRDMAVRMCEVLVLVLVLVLCEVHRGLAYVCPLL